MQLKDEEDENGGNVHSPRWGRDNGWKVCGEVGCHPICDMCRHQRAHLKGECREAPRPCLQAELKVIRPGCKPC